jgi:hypothetical protein
VFSILPRGCKTSNTVFRKITNIVDLRYFFAKPNCISRSSNWHCIGKRVKIQFCRDDPTLVLGSDAERKPDVVSIWKAALALGTRTSADNLSAGGPGRLDAFHWMELIAFWEFKFVPGGVDPGTHRYACDPAVLMQL